MFREARENFQRITPSLKKIRESHIFLKSTLKVIFKYFKRVLGYFGNYLAKQSHPAPLRAPGGGVVPAPGPPDLRSMVTVAKWSNYGAIPHLSYTALRNHMRIVFEGISSWTPLTMYLGMKTTF